MKRLLSLKLWFNRVNEFGQMDTNLAQPTKVLLWINQMEWKNRFSLIWWHFIPECFYSLGKKCYWIYSISVKSMYILSNKYQKLFNKTQNIGFIMQIHFVDSKIGPICCDTLMLTNNPVVKTLLIGTFRYRLQLLLPILFYDFNGQFCWQHKIWGEFFVRDFYLL